MLAPGTFGFTGDQTQGHDCKQFAYSNDRIDVNCVLNVHLHERNQSAEEGVLVPWTLTSGYMHKKSTGTDPLV